MLALYHNIKMLRTAQRMTQTELAHKMGYADRTMISHIEKGDVDIPISKVKEFARVFNVEAGELLGTTEEIELKDRTILEKYNALNDEGKALLIQQAQLLISGGYSNEEV